MLALIAVIALTAASRPTSRDDLTLVLGTADEGFLIDRIGDGIEAFVGQPAAEVIGRSILQLVQPQDATVVLSALAAATAGRTGVTLPIRSAPLQGQAVPWQLVVVPMVPRPSFGFVLLPLVKASESEDAMKDVERLIQSFGGHVDRGAASAEGFGFVAVFEPGLSRLTAREVEIVARLMAGDRVPAISRALFISQSTVRNHLSSVFRKLRVHSQQQLVDLLRGRRKGPHD